MTVRRGHRIPRARRLNGDWRDWRDGSQVGIQLRILWHGPSVRPMIDAALDCADSVVRDAARRGADVSDLPELSLAAARRLVERPGVATRRAMRRLWRASPLVDFAGADGRSSPSECFVNMGWGIGMLMDSVYGIEEPTADAEPRMNLTVDRKAFAERITRFLEYGVRYWESTGESEAAAVASVRRCFDAAIRARRRASTKRSRP